MIAIIDYGVGNLFSLRASLEKIGAEAALTSDEEVIRSADKIILPGVGAFEDAAKKLFSSGMADIILRETAKGKPLMGICLGMQLLFDKSYEFGVHEGLGLIKGEVKPLAGYIPEGLKIPQMGWNALKIGAARLSHIQILQRGRLCLLRPLLLRLLREQRRHGCKLRIRQRGDGGCMEGATFSAASSTPKKARRPV